MSTTKSVEDELFELLNSPDPVLSNKTVSGDGAPSSAFALTTASYADSQDFLSWLDDTSPTKILPEIKLEHAASLNTNDLNFLSSMDELTSVFMDTAAAPIDKPTPTAIENINVEPTIATTNANGTTESKVVTDSIYDEMFGTLAETTTAISPTMDTVKTSATFSSDYTTSASLSSVTLEQDIEKILSSPFPDVGRLRELIDQYGYIPTHQRLSALLLLLTGSCHADEEADRFAIPASEREFQRDLVADTQSLMKLCYPPHGIAPQVSMQHDLIDVVVLYCQRRSIDYKNIFCRLLISIFGEGEHQAKSVVSSCFYAIMNDFLPLVGLQYTELELATDAVHTWLRLLVIYHSPTLAQHMDRVLPGWEKKAKELTSAQSTKMSTLQKANSTLDSLEKEFGIDLGFDFESDMDTATDGNSDLKQNNDERSIASAPPKSSTSNNGMIQSHWLTTFFAGCLPAAQSAALMDWAIFNGERYAGVYFMASLLEIHAPLLEQMNATQLTQFFDGIATNQSDWFLPVTAASSSVPQSAGHSVSWSTFTEAWIHATSALLNNTPRAFRNALLRTESWASLAAERQREELSSQVQSLKQQSKALLAMDDVENDNFFETSLDEPLHGVQQPKTTTITTGNHVQKASKKSKKDNTQGSSNKAKTSKMSLEEKAFAVERGEYFDDGEDEDDDLMEDAKPLDYHHHVQTNHDNDEDDNDDEYDDRDNESSHSHNRHYNGYDEAGDQEDDRTYASGRTDESASVDEHYPDDQNHQNNGINNNNNNNATNLGGVARRASTLLMDNLRSFTAKLSATAVASAAVGGMGGVTDTRSIPRGPQHYPPLPKTATPTQQAQYHAHFPQDTKRSVETACLWSEASEIVPSICGSQRRTHSSLGTGGESTGERGETETLSSEDIDAQGVVRATYRRRVRHPLQRRCFFLSSNSSSSGYSHNSSGNSHNSNYSPWYFAIDCRAAEEKQLGLFPKAYAVDPDLITDGEALSHLLTVLAPLKNTVHIAVIGAGEAYHRFAYRQRHPRAYQRAVTRPPYTEPVELQRTLQEERNHVHAIAIFLIKRGFRFISVVDGGFVSAVEALHRPDSRISLQTALVDSDKARLFALLDVQDPAVVGTSTEKTFGIAAAQQQPVSLSSSTQAPSSILMSSSAAALAMSSSFASSQNQQHHPLATSSANNNNNNNASTTATSNSNGSNGSSNQQDNSGVATAGAASLASLSKNVGSLLSTWVTASSTGSAQSTTDSPVVPSSANTHSSSTASATAPSANTSNQTSSVSSSAAASTAGSADNNNTASLAGWGSSLMGKGLDTLKKGWGVTANLTASAVSSATQNSNNAGNSSVSNSNSNSNSSSNQDKHVKDPSTSFIIGDQDEDDDDGHKPFVPFADSHNISITRTDQERAQALALHRMAGLKKGDMLTISRAELPGAILFPCTKMKKMSIMVKKPASAATESSLLLDLDEPSSSSLEDDNSNNTMMVEQEIPVSRYLVITRERFMVLDTNIAQNQPDAGEGSNMSNKGGVGSVAMVKSNHHLTELIKMTFKKKDPELVTLFLLSSNGEPKPRQYRVVKYKDFVATLQKNMERFKI